MDQPRKPPDISIDTAVQLHRSALRLLRVLPRIQPEKDMSSAKLAVLGRLYKGGVTTVTALAAYLRVQPQSLTRLIADMEGQGLVSRRPDKEDRRRNHLEITDAGTCLVVEAVRDQRETLAQAMARGLTSAELGMLRIAATLIDQLVESIEAQIGSTEIR